MILGLTWPLSWPLEGLDERWLEAIKKETGLSWLRINLDFRNHLASQVVRDAENAGFKVLPIFDLDYTALMQPGAFEQPWWLDYYRFVFDMTVQHQFSHVEVMNEPDTPIVDHQGIERQRISPEVYAISCNAVGQAISIARPETKVIIATELLRADQKGPKKRKGGYWNKLKAGLHRGFIKYATVHPYRDPGAPQLSRFGKPWWEWWANGNRAAEWDFVKNEVWPFTPVVTEVGWDLPRLGNEEHLQAQHISDEIGISNHLNIPILMLYAHQGIYGLLKDDLSPRRAAHAVREWAQDVESDSSTPLGVGHAPAIPHRGAGL